MSFRLGLHPAILELSDGNFVGRAAVEWLDEIVVGGQIGGGGPEEGTVSGAHKVYWNCGQLLELVVFHFAGGRETLVGLILV